MSSTFLARALMALIAEEQGTPAVGTATVSSTGATGKVPAFAHAVPIIDGSEDEDFMIRVDSNPATADGSWDVVQAGTSLPITSVLAGDGVNLPVGTPATVGPSARRHRGD